MCHWTHLLGLWTKTIFWNLLQVGLRQWSWTDHCLIHAVTCRVDMFVHNFFFLTCETTKSYTCSPHNPTGKVFSKEELLIISQACQKMDCFAITDEVHLWWAIWIVIIPTHSENSWAFFIHIFPKKIFIKSVYLVSMCVNIFQVYEYITYDANKHISLASLPGMQERTIITSSLSKTYSVTGEHNSEFAAQFVVTQPTIEIATFLWLVRWHLTN